MSDVNTLWDNAPAQPVSSKPIEVAIVGARCVYVNDYRIAGGKPYFSEQLPYHTLKTSLGEVLSAFSERDIRAALKERRVRAKYFADYHARKAAETADA